MGFMPGSATLRHTRQHHLDSPHVCTHTSRSGTSLTPAHTTQLSFHRQRCARVANFVFFREFMEFSKFAPTCIRRCSAFLRAMMTSGSSVSPSLAGDPGDFTPLLSPFPPLLSPPAAVLLPCVATDTLLARRRSWLEEEDRPIT